MAENASGSNLLLGRGKLYFDRWVAGVAQGEAFLGNVESLNLTTTDEIREKYSSAEASAPLLASVNVRRKVELTAVLSEMFPENLALITMGATSALAQGSGSVSNEIIAVKAKDRWYPTAKRNISSVVVTGPSASPTYTVTTDYKVDAVEGRIYIVSTGSIPAVGDIEVDYAYAADTSTTVQGGASSSIEGSLRFVGDPAEGPKLTLQIWHVSLVPDGDLGLISDDFGTANLKMNVLADTTNHPTEPLYRIIQVAA